MVKNEGDKLTRVVVCSPISEYFNVKDPELHNIREVANRTRALEQHDSLKAVLSTSGCEVIDIPELPGHPNSVFVADPVLSIPEGYIRLRMGLPTRQGEEEWLAYHLNKLGEPCLGTIQPPGTVEGGDVILSGKVAFIGRSRRTNEDGIKQLTYYLRAMDYQIRLAIIPPPFLHLGGAMSLLGPESTVSCNGIFGKGFFEGFNNINIECKGFVSGNVISLGNYRIIAGTANKEVANILERAGFDVILIDLSEFIKGSGGPTCMIQTIERRGKF
ncbi:amidinotransferase [bacterium]|nr:amidinotransferase [bacterium]